MSLAAPDKHTSQEPEYLGLTRPERAALLSRQTPAIGIRAGDWTSPGRSVGLAGCGLLFLEHPAEHRQTVLRLFAGMAGGKI